MSGWLPILMLAGYLTGAIPFSFLVARARGVDLRKVGSGNTGASNVWRNLGFGYFLIAMLLDVSKGWLPTMLAHQVLRLPPLGVILVGLCTILGHVYPIYLGFRGGKAVATSGGVVLGIAPVLTLIGAGIWAATLALTRYPSVASLTAAAGVALIALGMALLGRLAPVYAGFIVVGALYVTYLHRSNIRRLLRGQELPIGSRR